MLNKKLSFYLRFPTSINIYAAGYFGYFGKFWNRGSLILKLFKPG
jgi:hypothetical protein